MSFKEKIELRFLVLRANLINSFRVDTAYIFEKWANIGSTVFYTLALLMFIKVLYSNIETFAGYTENEMLFLILVSQLNFYLDWTWSTQNINVLIEDVRLGNLDITLTKPVPVLFFVVTKSIGLLSMFRDAFPNILVLAILIRWDQIEFGVQGLIAGVAIFVLGQLAVHCFRFIFSLPVFFTGQSSQVFGLSGSLIDINNIPYEGFQGAVRFVFSTVVPALIAAQISTSVMLGKSDPYDMVFFSFVVAAILIYVRHLAWNHSLKNYSSASS